MKNTGNLPVSITTTFGDAAWSADPTTLTVNADTNWYYQQWIFQGTSPPYGEYVEYKAFLSVGPTCNNPLPASMPAYGYTFGQVGRVGE